MASLPKPTHPRRLCDLLQEQQEPFLLDQYLLEKGYSKKRLISKTKTKRRKGIPKCSKLLRSVFSKFVSGTKQHKLADFDTKLSVDERSSGPNCNSDMGRKTQLAEPNRFSSASSMTVYDSCSDSELEESICSLLNQLPPSPIRPQQASTERKHLQFGFHGDCKQLSPVSVLELPSHQRPPVHNHTVQFCLGRRKEEKPSTSSNFNLGKIVAEDSILSASLWETLTNSLRDKEVIEVAELDELVGSVSSSQYMKTKRVLQQTKQLLFDCVREVVETHDRKRRRLFGHEFLGSENLGIIICDQICSWVKQSGDITNTTQLIGLDFSRSTEEWSHFQPHVREIGLEIGEAIFEEIRDEIVEDIFDFLAFKRC